MSICDDAVLLAPFLIICLPQHSDTVILPSVCALPCGAPPSASPISFKWNRPPAQPQPPSPSPFSVVHLPYGDPKTSTNDHKTSCCCCRRRSTAAGLFSQMSAHSESCLTSTDAEGSGASAVPLPLSSGAFHPRLWSLVSTSRGDTILCLWASPSLCLVGTILGRVVGFSFSPPLDLFNNHIPMESNGVPHPPVRRRSSFSLFNRLRSNSRICKTSGAASKVFVRPERSPAVDEPPTSQSSSNSCFPCSNKGRESFPATSSANQVTPPGSVHVVASYSDEGIRAVRSLKAKEGIMRICLSL